MSDAAQWGQADERYLAAAETVEFAALFRDASGGFGSRSLLVATFLAILELTKIAAIRIYQGVSADGIPEGPIRIRRSFSCATSRGRNSSPWLGLT